ncbi:ribbon-helix-helix domain-containing protein [uncultured Bartonella sp.]|uniref:ribbon-helix-helix domain-containing protein n=1 Tax=uncultured Bartonella sp. TaxID=104108 RepID=UPI002625D6C5|nr:ribbon-helix-helix domain-containing protein [uncultured Bartonella sp.]
MLLDQIDWEKARLRKISVRIDGHATSISLEQIYIDILKRQADRLAVSFAAIVTMADEKRPPEINLSAALRIVALTSLKTRQ